MSQLFLQPCPFCGGEAIVQPWHGGRPTKKMISCSKGDYYDEDGGCSVGPHVCGETEEEAAASWNRRLLAVSPEQGTGEGWHDEEKLTPEAAWTYLCETPDITSPEEYPDHALITFEQLRSYMERAIQPEASNSIMEAAARIADRFALNNKFGTALQAFAASTVAKEIALEIRAMRSASAALPVPPTVDREDAIGFLEIAARNWHRMPKLSEDDLGDVATALLWFVQKKSVQPEGGAT